MKKNFLAGLTTLFLLFFLSGIASATIIFSDDFNTENGGVGQLNYNNFENWNVSDGTVDLIGNGYWQLGQDTSYGLFVDMDGSSSNAGKMMSLQTFTLDAGEYALSFDLAGNHRNGNSETVEVRANLGAVSADYSLGRYADFSTFTENFSLNQTTDITLSFEGLGGDNIGMLLDNVVLEKNAPVPEPATIFLLGIGLAGIFGIRKKSQK